MRNYSLLNWKEFGNDAAPSIRSVFQTAPYEGMDKIIEYLKSGKVGLIAIEKPRDAITGDLLGGSHAILSDGEYSWDSVLPYYVQKYNMRLPEEFENKVLRT